MDIKKSSQHFFKIEPSLENSNNKAREGQLILSIESQSNINLLVKLKEEIGVIYTYTIEESLITSNFIYNTIFSTMDSLFDFIKEALDNNAVYFGLTMEELIMEVPITEVKSKKINMTFYLKKTEIEINTRYLLEEMNEMNSKNATQDKRFEELLSKCNSLY